MTPIVNKTYTEFGDPNGVMWVHFNGNTFRNAPNYDNTSTSGPARIGTASKWPAPVEYITRTDYPSGFHFFNSILDARDGYSLQEAIGLLKDIGFKEGIISAHSFGGVALAKIINALKDYPEFKILAAIWLAPYNDGSITSLPKVEFKNLFIHAATDGVVNISSSKNYISMLMKSGNPEPKLIIEQGSNHEIGAAYFQTPKRAIVYDWVSQNMIKPGQPALPKPVGDIYQENGRYFLKLDNGKVVEVIGI